jgi:parallel beta-helix repeat protein
MDLQRIEELWSRLMAEDKLSSSEEQELTAALSADAQLRERLLLDEQVDGRLRFHFQQTDAMADAFVNSVGARIKAEGDGTRFTAKVTDQVRDWAESEQPRAAKSVRRFPWLRTGAIAAAILLAIGAAWFFNSRSREPVAVEKSTADAAPIAKQLPEKHTEPSPAPLYVATSGDNAGRGSQAEPVREISRAMALAAPGQTILVADGEYAAFEIKDLRGTKNRPITIKALGKNAQIAAEPSKTAAIILTRSRHIVIDGVTSRGNKSKSVFVKNSHGVTVRNCVLGDNGRTAIEFVHCNDAVIENNEIFNNQKAGIAFGNSGDRVTIRGNRLRNNGQGITLAGDLAAGGDDDVPGDGVISEVLIENNIVSKCGSSGAAVNLDGLKAAVVRNNLLFDNNASGIAVYKGSGASGAKDILIAQNTIDMSPTSRHALVISDLIGGIKIRNNILMARNVNRAVIGVDSTQSARLIDSDRNIFVENMNFTTGNDAAPLNLREWQALGLDKQSFSADARELFVEPGRDYHLRRASGALGRGDVIEPATPDLDNQSRPAGVAPDIGAYQAK